MLDKYNHFYSHIASGTYYSIIVLDGDIPEKSFFEAGLPIIAADGAMNALYRLGIKPKVVIGDLDSVDPMVLVDTDIIYKPDQNSCDFQKALAYAKEEHLLPAIIVGANGGYIDHVLNNINILLQQNCVFYSDPIAGHVVSSQQERVFSLVPNTKISLIGFPQASLSTQGLYWELQNDTLSFPGYSSCFNRTQSPEVSIKVHSGHVLILIYL